MLISETAVSRRFSPRIAPVSSTGWPSLKCARSQRSIIRPANLRENLVTR